MVVVCYTSLPWSDGWTQIFVAARGENPFSLRWLWQQHNEHRLLIPKLFLAFDLHFFAATQKLLLVSIFVIQLLHLWLLSWSMRTLGGWRGAQWRAGAGLVAFCLFCPSQWENLTWGFQTCFVLPGLFATLSFVLLLLYWDRSQQRMDGAGKFVVLSVMAAVAGICSLANGLLLFPLLLLAALVLRLRYSVVATYATAAFITTALYFHNYLRPPQNSDPASSVRVPIRLVEYIATYFGSSWTFGNSWTHHNLQTAPYFGFAGIVLTAIFLGRFRRIKAESHSFSALLLLIMLFCFGTAFLTALGRVAYGNGQAFASRYQTVALLFWLCLGCLAIATFQGKLRHIGMAVVQLLLVSIMLRGAALARFPLRDAREHSFQQRAAAAALITGVDDQPQIERTFPDADNVLGAVPFMREHRLSVFSQPSPIDSHGYISLFGRILSKDACEGELQTVDLIKDGRIEDVRISGWTWDIDKRRPATEILVTSNGSIIGLGATGDWRPTIRATRRYMNTSFVGFTAYAKGGSPPLIIYAVTKGDRPQACEIATIQPWQAH